jgi:diguanylate cyclase (GGDEF)-like protein/PAS domain S-box-containing protein
MSFPDSFSVVERSDSNFLKAIIDLIPGSFQLIDESGRLVMWNRHLEEALAYVPEETASRSVLQFVDIRDRAAVIEATRTAFESGEVSVEARVISRDGRSVPFYFSGRRVEFDSRPMLIVIGVDISERKRAESALAESQALLNAVIDSAGDLIWSVDVESFGLLTFNAGLRNYFERKHDLVIEKGMRPEDLLPAEFAQTWYDFYRRALREGAYSIEYTTSAGTYVLDLRFNLLLRDGVVFGISVFGANITERKASEARIQFLAHHDMLTELPNRVLAEERFKLARSYASRADAKIALLFLDLDNFKAINDALGHSVGDHLLKIISRRLAKCVRQTDTVCRLGGDEFLIILTDIHHLDDVAARANKFLEQLPEPMEIEGQVLSVTASIGIAMYPGDAEDMEGLMKKADTAMFVAKDAGRNDFRFFDDKFNSATTEALAIRNELRLALEKRELVLHYQPQVDLASGRLIGAEALLRWNSPSRGMVPPAAFIPIIEESGLIVQVGEWVLLEACRQAAEWRRLSVGDNLTVAVNLSAVQFMRGNLEASVLAALESSGLEPRLLELELTESILLKDPEQVLDIVQRLKRLGLSFSIDDFGTGYSNLSYLKRFPVDKLKIDQSFIRNMVTDVGDAEIVRAIIQMARAFGLKTIAEGIEDENTTHHLRVQNCDEGQGYHFARPLSADSFAAYVARATA